MPRPRRRPRAPHAPPRHVSVDRQALLSLQVTPRLPGAAHRPAVHSRPLAQRSCSQDSPAAASGARGKCFCSSYPLQIEQALLGIRSDDDGRGAATYSWAIVLVRPGVYISGQPAEELLCLSVERADPPTRRG
jgi:hypothetical protein